MVSDIATDTRRIAKRMKRPALPRKYSANDVPDSEYLRVHALRLADAFEEVRAEKDKANRKVYLLEQRIEKLREVMDYVFEWTLQCQEELDSDRIRETIEADDELAKKGGGK